MRRMKNEEERKESVSQSITLSVSKNEEKEMKTVQFAKGTQNAETKEQRTQKQKWHGKVTQMVTHKQ